MYEKTITRMIYVTYFIFFLGCLFTLVAFVNLITNVYLPKKVILDSQPFISILIPARNEERNIENLLDDIQQLSYTNYEVIVYNDQSTDKTQEIVEKKMLSNNKIQLVQGEALKKCWLGKNYACHNLALRAKGKYLLFLDADVRVSGALIEKALTMMKRHNLGLLSIFPKQILDNKGAWFTVPLMNWILLSLLPLILVRISSWTSFSAANGQFMFFKTEIYRIHQPHLRCKELKVEDIAICRYYKKQKVKVATLLGNSTIQCKMYESLDDAVNGFSKNVFAFFGDSIFMTLLFAAFTTLAPFFLLFGFGFNVFMLYALIILIKKVIICKASQQEIGLNLLYIPMQHFMFLKIIFSALIKRDSLTWKGRSIK